MENKLKKKLKKKIWIISSITLVVYSATLISNPNSWIALLPIIIPTGILTVGIPAYAIIRNTKEHLDNLTEQPFIKEEKVQVSEEVKTNTINKQPTEINNFIEQHYEIEETQEKNKVKTKGTI